MYDTYQQDINDDFESSRCPDCGGWMEYIGQNAYQCSKCGYTEREGKSVDLFEEQEDFHDEN